MRRLLAALAALLACGAQATELTVNAGPYVPSPHSVVADMLKLARVGPQDYVIDLGSGDGRIVLTAAKVFGARGFGVEIKDELVAQANAAARAQGLAARVRFIQADLFQTDISQATVLTLYLLPHTVNLLRDKLFAELRPDTRVISHDYPLGGWHHVEMVHMDLDDKLPISGTTTTLIYLYRVPEKVAGRWRVSVPASVHAGDIELELAQQYTRLSGAARIAGARVPIADGRVVGRTLSFTLHASGTRHAFEGDVIEGTAYGMVQSSAGQRAAWRAVRATQTKKVE
ncbi:MAG: methyltransferase domain-containing protein [Burkholderiales bacterium]|nr:methyltransferase domain-containing protein [Burkholderiales bacterium]